METDPQSASIFTQLLILLVLTLIRGYFAGAEMAVASVNKNKIHRLKEQGNTKAALIEHLMEGSTAFLSAIQLIVTLAGFLSSAAAAIGISEILAVKMNQWGIPGSRIAALVLVTIILVYVNLVFGELIPKRIALQNAEKFSLSCIGLVYFASCVVKPFVGLLNVSTSGILKLFGMHHEDLESDVSEEEIKSLLETGSETGVFNEIEKEMITSIFSFDDKKAKEVMVPRQDMVAINIDEPVDSYLDDILQSMHSKIPVYQEDIDNIIGILSTKALTIEARKKSFEDLDIRSLLTPAYFVPENRRTDALFREMQQKKEKLAILIDEYGGVSGMVTLEDLIEVIVGDIHEEYEEVEPEIIEQEPGHVYFQKGCIHDPIMLYFQKGCIQEPGHVYSLSGSIALSDLKEEFHLDVDSVYDTLSGYLIEALGYIPTEKALPLTVTTPEADYEILKMDDRVIGRVKMTLKEAQAPETGDAT